LKLVWQNGEGKKGYERQKQIKAAGRRKQTKESAAEQLYVVNCAWIMFNWSQ